jgi:carbonic anhydrase
MSAEPNKKWWGVVVATPLVTLALVVLVNLVSPGAPEAAGGHGTAVEATASHGDAAPHWGYTGAGAPQFWATLDPANILAREGRAQSPINIVPGAAVPGGSVRPPEFHYTPTAFELENNGHTQEAIPATQNNYILLDGRRYVLQQFHFHAKSEHQIDGEHAPMEVHLVHKDGGGNLAVVGIMLTAGSTNAVLAETFSSFPRSAGSVELHQPIDLTGILPGGPLYRYDGSLTTPPCSEGVKWSVFADGTELAPNQINAFTRVYKNNYRPVQNLNGRPVYATQ